MHKISEHWKQIVAKLKGVQNGLELLFSGPEITFLKFEELSGPLKRHQDLSEPFRTFQDLSEPFKTFQNLSRPFRTFHDLSKPFKTFQNYYLTF